MARPPASTANFRQIAQACLRRAETLVKNGSATKLRYAALELRLATEALAYERAEAYEKDFPPSTYDAWQPRKVLASILEINPRAFVPREISVEFEEGSGEYVSLGQERPINLEDIKSHYDALGSYLHTPTLRQALRGGHEVEAMRRHCEQMADKVRAILTSTMFNIDYKLSGEFDCLRCGTAFKVRAPEHGQEREATCPECHAPYSIRLYSDNTFTWRPIWVEKKCKQDGCGGSYFFWRSEIKPDAEARCDRCERRYKLKLISTILSD